MELTKLEKALILTLGKTDLTEEDQEAIFLFLKTEEQQYRMLDFLHNNPKASNQEILHRYAEILAGRELK